MRIPSIVSVAFVRQLINPAVFTSATISIPSDLHYESKIKEVGDNYKILQASFDAKGKAYFQHCKVPTSSLFDLEVCRDAESQFSYAVPTAKHFQEYVTQLGVGNSSHVIVYDPYPATMGFLAAPRLWWLFKVFGHDNVSVMDGGLMKWIQMHCPLETKDIEVDIKHQRRIFDAEFQSQFFRSYTDLVQNIKSREFEVIDARCHEDFEALDSFDASRLRIPYAKNLFFESLLDINHQCLKSRVELIQYFQDVGVNFQDSRYPLLTIYSHSSISACAVALAADYCGKSDVAIFDGGWEEWCFRRNNNRF